MDIQQSLWNNFVQGKILNLDVLPDSIAESWQYCRTQNVNPYIRGGTIKIEQQTLKSKRREYAHVIGLVKSEIRNYQTLFQEKYPLFILTDAQGCIIWREVHQESKDFANNFYFNEGSIWTEKEVGTNAIGIALRKNIAVTVHGYEHYSVASHPFTCTSHPLYNEENELIGCLDVTHLNKEEMDQYVLAALKVISQNVQKKLIYESAAKTKYLLENAFGKKKTGIVCDEKFKIVKISDELDIDEKKWIGKEIEELKRKQKINSLIESVTHENQVIGYFYSVKPNKIKENFQVFGIKSQNMAYQEFLSQVKVVSKSLIPVHIFGESGSGKEIAVKTIHYNSLVSNGPLVSVNCGGMSESLLESELFGYVSGAFTGAQTKGYKGKIEQANKGTLFLDEIDYMSMRMQVGLLRVLEDKKVTPIGSEKNREVDFRIITASNQDLKQLVEQKKFRLDLFYRLYVVPLSIPPLRERHEDIQVFISDFCHEKQWQPSWKKTIEKIAIKYEWEGNFRELGNFMERLYLFYHSKIPSESEISEVLAVGSVSLKKSKTKDTYYPDVQLDIEKTLRKNNYHLSKTANDLGIARSTLYRRIEKYKIKLLN